MKSSVLYAVAAFAFVAALRLSAQERSERERARVFGMAFQPNRK